MDKDQPIYDLSVLARYNLHVHSKYSSCAKSEMTMENIIKYAENHHIKTLAITDHFHDCKILEHNRELKKQAEKLNTKVNILYGAELSAYGINKYADPLEVNKALDYRLYSYNHFHLKFWEQPEDKSPEGYVKYQIAVLTDLLKSGRADCIAHPFVGSFIHCINDETAVTRGITDNQLGDIMKLGKDKNVAWEINFGAIMGDQNFAKRYWNIGKEIGVRFNFGTDAHTLAGLDSITAAKKIEAVLA